MKESIIETIQKGKIIVDMTGVGKYSVLRTGAALLKADVPACVIDFDKENLDYVFDFTRLLADRFGPDIIICANNIDSKKTAKLARKAGVKAAFCSPDKKTVSYLKKKGISVFLNCKTDDDVALAKALLVDAVRLPSRAFKTDLPIILQATSLDDLPDAYSGEYIPEFSSPIVTKELLESESYLEIEQKSLEILRKFN